MHDPMTVAFEIKYPWAKSRTTLNSGRVHVYREAIVTVWHVDPETDGSDDSCGYTLPHLTDHQRERIKWMAWSEGRSPYFLRCAAKEWTGPRPEAEALYRALLLHVARAIGVRMSFDEAAKRASVAIHKPDAIDAAGRFCFLPGYHTNFADRDTAEDRSQVFLGTISGIGTVPLRALELGRVGRGTELNPSYWADGVTYHRAAEEKLAAPTLFDLLDAEGDAA